MSASNRVNKQYMVNIQKSRSVISLIACVITLVCSVSALSVDIAIYVKQGWPISEMFSYFTTLSNILISIASSFIVPFAIDGIRYKRFIMPKWLSMLHYSGIICISLVFIFVLVAIMPYDMEFAVGGPNFFLHIISPIAIIISFFMVESHYNYSHKELLVCMIPFFIYSIVYVVMVAVLGPEKGGWEDLYMLNTFLPAAVSLPIVYLVTYALARILRKLSDVLYDYRRKHLLSSWSKDIDLVEVKIEVYGLGRFYGLNGDENSLSVPMDIMELVADRYNVSTRELYTVYTKGLFNGICERENKLSDYS